MTDEKYSYIQDVKDKKITARSARNKRTHNGKGGSVKLPSDYMTKKEIKAMSGEVKSYRLNEPMNWKEFKAMPNDIQVAYIKLLKEKFCVPNNAIEKMFGLGNGTLVRHLEHIGLSTKPLPRGDFDREGWYGFVHGVPTQKEEPVEDVPHWIDKENAPPILGEDQKEVLHPCSGTLCFVGTAEGALDAMRHILGNETMKITISWEAV